MSDETKRFHESMKRRKVYMKRTDGTTLWLQPDQITWTTDRDTAGVWTIHQVVEMGLPEACGTQTA